METIDLIDLEYQLQELLDERDYYLSEGEDVSLSEKLIARKRREINIASKPFDTDMEIESERDYLCLSQGLSRY